MRLPCAFTLNLIALKWQSNKRSSIAIKLNYVDTFHWDESQQPSAMLSSSSAAFSFSNKCDTNMSNPEKPQFQKYRTS